MNILFICGSLEPGRDGVGDYIRRLAYDIKRIGHNVALLAINDPFITSIENNTELANDILPYFRIPSNASFKAHKSLDKWISSFNPDWISLQYVPFSFNKKGLPFGLSKYISKLISERNFHIMFHELWIGMEENSTLKYKIWGGLQKLLLKSLVRNLKPNLIHTQTKLYQLQLEKLGYKTEYLPLFSNIPFVNTQKTEYFNNIETNSITFVNFGTIHPNSPFSEFTRDAVAYKLETGKELELILIGRSGSDEKNWIENWQSAGLKLTVLGEQSPSIVSEQLSKATFGLSSTALPLIEKSGSVAAMFEHKLPVICISKEWKPKGIKTLPHTDGVIEYKSGNLNYCLSKNAKIKNINIADVSYKLIEAFLSY